MGLTREGALEIQPHDYQQQQHSTVLTNRTDPIRDEEVVTSTPSLHRMHVG
jgi:hypothetical protein